MRGGMAIAPQQPHPSWYRQFWYAERSPRDTLTDRALIFAIVALGLLAGGMSLVQHHAVALAEQETVSAQAPR
jgi:hypothetical protein